MAGFKTFTAAVLTAADVNGFLMRQTVIQATSATRPSSPHEGMLVFEIDTNIFQFYDGTRWQQLNIPLCTSATRPTAPLTGAIISETDTGRVMGYTGSGWAYIGSYLSQTTNPTDVADGGMWSRSDTDALYANFGGTATKVLEWGVPSVNMGSWDVYQASPTILTSGASQKEGSWSVAGKNVQANFSALATSSGTSGAAIEVTLPSSLPTPKQTNKIIGTFRYVSSTGSRSTGTVYYPSGSSFLYLEVDGFTGYLGASPSIQVLSTAGFWFNLNYVAT